MRFSFVSTLVVALAAEGAVAITWFGKSGVFINPKHLSKFVSNKFYLISRIDN